MENAPVIAFIARRDDARIKWLGQEQRKARDFSSGASIRAADHITMKMFERAFLFHA
jgi:hypothetical protein